MGYIGECKRLRGNLEEGCRENIKSETVLQEFKIGTKTYITNVSLMFVNKYLFVSCLDYDTRNKFMQNKLKIMHLNLENKTLYVTDIRKWKFLLCSYPSESNS